MVKEEKVLNKYCDGCGALDSQRHMSAGHYSTGWFNQRGYDLCRLCEIILKDKLFREADEERIKEILGDINPVHTFGGGIDPDTFTGYQPTYTNLSSIPPRDE